MRYRISENKMNRIVRQVMREAIGDPIDNKKYALSLLNSIYQSLGPDAEGLRDQFVQLYNAIESLGRNQQNAGQGYDLPFTPNDSTMSDDGEIHYPDGGMSYDEYEDPNGIVLSPEIMVGSGNDGNFTDSDPLWRQIISQSRVGRTFDRAPTRADIEDVENMLYGGSVALSYIRKTNGDNVAAGSVENRIGTKNPDIIRHLGGNPTPTADEIYFDPRTGAPAAWLEAYFDYTRKAWRQFVKKNLRAAF